MRKRIAWLPAVIAVLFVAACSDDGGPGTAVAPDPGLVTVTGEVTEKDDQVPVDGGVTIKLKLDDGSIETLYFGSLFTSPPPSQEQIDLYAVLMTVNVGDRVKAEGVRVEGGIMLEDLTILETGSP